MDPIQRFDIWELPSGAFVRVLFAGGDDIEVQYVDSLLGESFFVRRLWLIRCADWRGQITVDAQRTVALNTEGMPIGEGHWRAKFSDEEIERVWALHQAGLSYEQIASKWDAGKPMSKSHVRNIITGSRRGQPVAGHRREAK